MSIKILITWILLATCFVTEGAATDTPKDESKSAPATTPTGKNTSSRNGVIPKSPGLQETEANVTRYEQEIRRFREECKTRFGALILDIQNHCKNTENSQKNNLAPEWYVKKRYPDTDQIVGFQDIISGEKDTSKKKIMEETLNKTKDPTPDHHHTAERVKILQDWKEILGLEKMVQALKSELIIAKSHQETLKKGEAEKKALEEQLARLQEQEEDFQIQQEEFNRRQKEFNSRIEETQRDQKAEAEKLAQAREEVEKQRLQIQLEIQENLKQVEQKRKEAEECVAKAERSLAEQEEKTFLIHISSWLRGEKTDKLLQSPRATDLISTLSSNISGLFKENLPVDHLVSYKFIKEKLTNTPDASDLFKLTISYRAHRDIYQEGKSNRYWIDIARKMGTLSGAVNLVGKCHDFLNKPDLQDPDTSQAFKKAVEDMFDATLCGDGPLGVRKRPATKDELAIIIPALRASGARILNAANDDIMSALKTLSQRYLRAEPSENSQLFNHQVGCFFIAIGGLSKGKVEDAQIQEALGSQSPVCQILSKRQHYHKLLETYSF